jgi:hypothetical protein
LFNIASIVTEEADKRSWRTLPDKIQMSRILLPPGNYDIDVHYIGTGGEIIDKKTFSGISIHSREKKILTHRVVK